MAFSRTTLDSQQRIVADYDAYYDQLRCHSFGQLYKRFLENLRIDEKDLRDHLKIHNSSILNRFWADNVRPRKSKKIDSVSVIELIKALGENEINGKAVDDSLDEDQIDRLTTLYEQNITVDDVRKLHADLYYRDASRGYVSDFEDFYPNRYKLDTVNRENADRIQQYLEKEWRPAFLSFRDWSIHAFNRTVFLFFIAQREQPEEFLLKRDCWHLLAGKLADDSRIRDVYRKYDTYFPPTIDVFAKRIYPYLFTIQVRYLLARLHMLSDKNGLNFGTWWKSAEVLNLKYEDSIERTLVYYDQIVRAEANLELPLIRDKMTERIRIPQEEVIVDLTGGDKDSLLKSNEEFTGHWIGIWNPLDKPTRNLFKDLADTPTFDTEVEERKNKKVFYAAEYEQKYVDEQKGKVSEQEFWDNYPFHINHRPWVESEVDRILFPPGRRR